MKKITSLFTLALLLLGLIISLAACSGGNDTACNHEWSEWTVVEAPTCTKGGYSTRTCTLCSESVRMVLYPSDHTYAEEWMYDGSYHWRPATCQHIDQKADYEPHTFDGNTCSVCGTVKASQGLQYRGDLVNGTYTVIGTGTTLETDIVVARYYNGHDITAVGAGAFSGIPGLKSVWLQRYILSVGDRAFADSPDLTTVTLTYGLEYIGAEVFSGCTSLEKVVFFGTVEDFNAIEKAQNWDAGHTGYIIECVDGNIEK